MAEGVKLSSAGPDDANKNGLGPLLADAIDDPLQPHLIVAVVNTGKITEDPDTGARQPTLRFLHIEVVPDDCHDAIHDAIVKAYAQRTGQDELPFEADAEVRLAMGQRLKKDGTITQMRRRRGRSSSHPGE